MSRKVPSQEIQSKKFQPKASRLEWFTSTRILLGVPVVTSLSWISPSLISLSLIMSPLAMPQLATAQPATPTTGTGKLTVLIQGVDQPQGQLCLSLFGTAQGFPSKPASALQSRCVEVTGRLMTVTFEGLEPGNYAVAVFHDLNKDGILNQNRLGVPTERFGFSNNPRIFAGPPKFSDSTILLAGQETNIQIRLRGLLG